MVEQLCITFLWYISFIQHLMIWKHYIRSHFPNKIHTLSPPYKLDPCCIGCIKCSMVYCSYVSIFRALSQWLFLFRRCELDDQLRTWCSTECNTPGSLHNNHKWQVWKMTSIIIADVLCMTSTSCWKQFYISPRLLHKLCFEVTRARRNCPVVASRCYVRNRELPWQRGK